MFAFFSILTGLVFLIALGFHVGLMCRAVLTRRSLGLPDDRATIAWGALYGAVLLGLSVWGLLRLIDGGPLAWLTGIVSATAIIALSLVTLNREAIFERLRATEPAMRHRIEWGLLLLFGVFSMLMIEWPWSTAVLLFGPSYWWLEIALTLLVTLFFYLVGKRHGSAALITAFAYAFIGLAQFFVRRFKNAAILPNDLLVLDTAMAVSNQYTFSLDPRAVMGMAVALAGICVLSLLHPTWSVQADDPARGNVGRDTGKGFISLALCAALVLIPNYMQVFQVQIMYWYSINYYEKQGFLPTFIAVWQDLPIHKPKEYDSQVAEELTAELSKSYEENAGSSVERQEAVAQFEELKPTVLVVMNESFADLSEFDGLRAGYEGPQYFKSMSDALWRGKLFVNVHGGGTCNTEFEFLTGNSLGYIGAGKYPYSTFPLGDVDNLARQFKQLGYATCAIHPNYASNWSRNKVYPGFGFDQFLDIDAFGGFPEFNLDGTKKSTTPTGVPVFHSGVSDQATYERVLEMLEADETPQFIFDVTMQNHGSYDQFNIPEDKLTHVYPKNTYETPGFVETPERLNEYLSCIEESDRALKWLVARLKKLDRPVVLVFFGDHQPSMTPDYNDLWYQGEDDITHTQRVYHADYVIWANYDVAGSEQRSDDADTSVDVLGSIVLDAIGAPLTTYEEAQLAVNEQIKATNLHGYLGVDGTWYTPDDEGPYAELYDKMSFVEYLNFADRIS